ncbi:hypothetical protein BC830DRAFT_1110168 [Chytriomyces sp. MP71]|nr:hypothetical protein BC830DRAFT_1110168 [Chytriomyces sp. MP71]
MFKGLKYRTCDLSLFVLRGHITFRYWAWASANVSPLVIRLDGAELFVYNNSSAYAYMKSILEREKREAEHAKEAENLYNESPTVGGPSISRHSRDPLSPTDSESVHAPLSQDPKEPPKPALPSPNPSLWSRAIAALMPVDLIGYKGAIVIGTPDLKSLFVADFKSMQGSYSREVQARAAPGVRPELCQYNVKLRLANGRISFRANAEYRDPSLNQAARIRAAQEGARRRKFFGRSAGTELLQSEILDLEHGGGVEWIGLGRYADEVNALGGMQGGARAFANEYAIVEEAIVTDHVDFLYFVDDAGITGHDSTLSPPKWGAELILHKSTLNYGPWTSRQRSMIQSFFFPSSYRTSAATPVPDIGYHRLFPKFELTFKFEGGCTFKIPFREASKDLNLPVDASIDPRALNDLRSPAWLAFKFPGSESHLKIDIPMVSQPNGYKTVIAIKMSNVSLSTSLNYAELLNADTLELEMLMPSPVKWNGERTWKYNISTKGAKVWFLMDHVSFLQDLANDMSHSPSPANPALFVPIAYEYEVSLHDTDVYLCTNQHNVIQVANDVEENSFVILKSTKLVISARTPYLLANPLVHSIDFGVQAEHGKLFISHPSSHAIGAFLTDEAKDVGDFKSLTVAGLYEYMNMNHPVVGPDSLSLDVALDSAALKAYGYVINGLLDLISNYLTAEFKHSLNVEEYRLKLSDPTKFRAQRPPSTTPHENVNDFEISVDVRLKDSLLILPEDLFACKYGSILALETVTVELASNAVEQDLKVVLDPISWSRSQIPADFCVETVRAAFDVAANQDANCIRVLGLEMFNRQLLGPKPKYALYAADFTVHVHSISGEISPAFVHGVLASLQTVSHHLENADDRFPWAASPVIALLKLRIDPVKISLWGLDSVTILDLPKGLKIQIDSLITARWTSRTLVDIPDMNVKSLIVSEEEGAATKRIEDHDWIEVMNFDCSVSVAIFSRDDNIESLRVAQKQFVVQQDRETKRCDHLFSSSATSSSQQLNRNLFKVPVGLDYNLDYDPDLAKKTRAKTQSATNVRKSVLSKLPKSEGASPYASRSSSFLGSRFSLDATYKTHLRSFQVSKSSHGTITEFIPSRSEFGSENRPTARRRPFPYQEIDLLNNADLTGVVPHSKIIIRTSECVKVLVTPFALKIVQQFVQLSLDVDKLQNLTLLDALQTYYTRLITKPVTSKVQYSTFITSTPEFHAQLIQDMKFPDIPENNTEHGHNTRFDISDSTLCAVDIQNLNLLQVVGVGMKCLSSAPHLLSVDDFYYSLDVEALKTSVRFLDASVQQRVVGIPHSKQLYTEFPELPSISPVVLDMFASEIKVGCDFEGRQPVSQVGVTVHSKSFELIFVNETVEIVAGAALVWTVFARDLYYVIEKYLTESQVQLQSLVWAIVDESMQHFVIGDPRFLTSPTAIWLLGSTYRKHQADLGWKMLQRLRYCARQLGWDTKIPQTKKLNKTLLLNDVAGSLGKWLGSRIVVSKNHLLSLIFETKSSDQNAFNPIQALSKIILSVVLHADTARVATHDVGSSENVLYLRSIVLDISSSTRHKQDVLGLRIVGSNALLAAQGVGTHFVDMTVLASVSKANLAFNPNIFRLLRHATRVYNRVSYISSASSHSQSSAISQVDFALIASFAIDEFGFSASANSLQMTTAIRKVISQAYYYNNPASFNIPENLWLTGSLTIKESVLNIFESSFGGPQNLFSVYMTAINASASGSSASLVGIDLVEVQLPKSILKLQAFFEHWSDALPEYDLMINKFIKELERTSFSVPGMEPTVTLALGWHHNIQFAIKRFELISDLLSTLRACYSINNFLFLLNHISDSTKVDNVCTAQIASHKIEFEVKSMPRAAHAEMSSYILPNAVLKGTFSNHGKQPLSILHASLFVGLVEGSLDAHLVDQLLTAQSLLGSEINDIVEMAMFYYKRRNAAPLITSVQPEDSNGKAFLYDIKVLVLGMKVVAESPQSKLLLGSKSFTMKICNILGKATYKLTSKNHGPMKWSLGLQSLSAELVSAEMSLARILIDLELCNHSKTSLRSQKSSEADISLPLFLHVNKVLGVLHPVGLSKSVDFILFFSKELEQRSQARQVEIDIMKQNAERLFSSVNSTPLANQVPDAKSFFRDKVFWIKVSQISMAVPLQENSLYMSALLISIQDLQYESNHMIENLGGFKDISVQFVDSFNQDNEASFSPSSHPVQNRFILHDVEGKISQFFKEGFGEIKILGKVKGFELDLNSSIADHVNSLLAIYGKEKDLFGSSTAATSVRRANTASNLYTATTEFTEVLLNAEIIFGAGMCKINCEKKLSATKPVHARKASAVSNEDGNYDLQVFTVPGIGFIVDGTTIFGNNSSLADHVQRGFYIQQHIYESENVLHPTVLSFFLEALSKVNLDAFAASQAPKSEEPQSVSESGIATFVSQKQSITYILKLSQTKVILSCLPESKVALNFLLEEANVLFSVIPTSSTESMNAINITCSVKGANGSLRHSFSPEDCFKWNLSELIVNGSLLFNQKARNYTLSLDSASISSALNVRQLQDLFLFQRLWITPVLLSGETSGSSQNLSDPGIISPYAAVLRFPGYGTNKVSYTDSFHLIVRLPLITLSADLGQAIGKASVSVASFYTAFDIEWTEKLFGSKKLLMSLDSIDCHADGRYSGQANIIAPQLYVVGLHNFKNPAQNKVVTKALFNLERIEVQLQYQYERILIVDLQPLDYSFNLKWVLHNNELVLCSGVGFVADSFKVIMSRKTIPAFYQLAEKLLSIIEEKFNLDMSLSPPTSPRLRRGSKMVSRILLPISSELSSVPGKMMRAMLEGSSGIKVVGQVNVLVRNILLNFMRLNFRDTDCARVISKDVSFSLEHEGVAKNNLQEALRVTLDGVSIKKGTIRSLTPEEERMWSTLEWFSFIGSSPSKNVATVPAITITLETLSNLLDRRVQISGQTEFAAQIDIALNFGLYRFLLDLFEGYNSSFKSKSEKTDPSLITASQVEAETIAFEYNNGDFKFDPQLKVTGEATPRELIEWLGVNKTKIPEFLYQNLSMNLSELLVFITRHT